MLSARDFDVAVRVLETVVAIVEARTRGEVLPRIDPAIAKRLDRFGPLATRLLTATLPTIGDDEPIAEYLVRVGIPGAQKEPARG